MWGEIQEALADLQRALAKSRERGAYMVIAEAKYYEVKALKTSELMEQGYSATAVALLIKGQPEVNAAMREYHDWEVLYKNAVEAVNVYKKKLDVLREEYEREWSRSGNGY